MDLGLQGKHAIVTGGSRGIGKAISRELAREGAYVAIVARNRVDLEATARELAAETNRRIVPLAADVTSKEQVDRMVAEAAQQLARLHILVNSGSAPGGSATATGPIETVIDEDLLQDFNVKYVGALRGSRAVIPFMKMEGWGRIINISGANARNAGNLSGGARNSAMVHMTKTLAVQLGRHGITVNCIHPARPAPNARRACSLPAPPSWAYPRKMRSGTTSLRTLRAAMPSAAWWTPRRSRSSRYSWPRIRPGRSPASWSPHPEGPGERYFTK
jgi:NAD(P)-dependent dehydrogenase (short-subunit alcohol dehydrogenase family)